MARDRYFDRRFGVDTAGCIEVEDMADVADDAKEQMVEYRPTPATNLAMAIDNALSHWPPEQVPDATFIDLGCGKGRALLVASQFPFQRVTGVELSQAIAEVAGRNLDRTRVRPVCGSTRVIHGDATTIDFPETPICLYLFNPFHEPIVRVIEERLRQSVIAQPRPVIILYANAQHADVFRESSIWKERDSEDGWWAIFDAVNSPVSESSTVASSLDRDRVEGV